ncbi:unnamed protein product, partial [Owenia fusiformis]
GSGDTQVEVPDNSSYSEDNLLKWMEISIVEPEKRTGKYMNIPETFMVYLIETKVTDPTKPGHGEVTSIWRRYSEFELLRNYLDIMYPPVVVPPLPEKRVSHVWQKLPSDKFDPDFIERRRQGLENFLLRTAAHSILCKDELFTAFLNQDEGWKEKIYATGYQNKADSKIKALSAAYRLKKPDKRFEEFKAYSNELQTHIHNILRIRAKMADQEFGVHRIHANYGRVFSEWSGLEKEMGDGLQSAGHFMDSYSSCIDGILEDEESFADQLKEYYAFGDALRSVCRKQELVQLKLEQCEDALSYKAAQKELLNQGKSTGGFSFSGMKSKLFGGDTPQQRQEKIEKLEKEIEEQENELRAVSADAQKFVEDALNDIDRFQRQKVKDLKEILTNYAIVQIEKCKKGKAIWQNTKECFEKM